MPPSSASLFFSGEEDAAQSTAATHTDSSPRQKNTLFPDLEFDQLVSVSLSTPERSFDFRFNADRDVSVNGHRADKDIFSTLIEQIYSLPVDPSNGFSPSASPMLTLVISTQDGKNHTAHFYDSCHSEVVVHVRTGPEHAPVWQQTDAWRVGTLMMACEGTRIQDESGNETPL